MIPSGGGGGKRPGAGRPREPNKRVAVTVRLPPDLVEWLRAQPDSQSAVIRRALEREAGFTA